MSLKSSHLPPRNSDAVELEKIGFTERRSRNGFTADRLARFSPVCDVPRGAGRFKQCVFHQEFQHRRARAFGAACHDVLLNLCGAETLPS